jgi:RNA methyltransferase, TrmH family
MPASTASGSSGEGDRVITSAANPRLKLVRRLSSRRQRERLGLFVCEGEDLVAAALEQGIHPVEVLVDAERPPFLDGLPDAEPVDPRLLAEVSALAHPPRIIGVFRRADLPQLNAADAPAVGLALWHVGDPGNIGTVLRTSDGLGPAFVALSPGCGDPTGPKALRASAGAIFRVPLGRFDDAPRPRAALVTRGGTPLPELELPERVTYVAGAEREGLPEDIAADCEFRTTIPLAPTAESLNVAVSAAIALYEWRRRRS